MAGDQERPDDGDWAWLGRKRRDIMGCLVFARAVTPERVIEAFEMDPSAARMLPHDRASEAVTFPVSGEDGYTVNPWIRAGKYGDWAFAIAETGLDLANYHDAAAMNLSGGTEAVVVHWTPKPTHFMSYLINGSLVTSFDLGMPSHRTGSDPDRFVTEMRQAGLQTERPDPEEQRARVLERRARILAARREGRDIEVFDPLLATLEMLTRALCIRLPEEVARGPLLTVQRAPRGDPPRG